MKINEFVKQFTNHPVLFVGTGVSLRYLQNSFTWDGLVSRVECRSSTFEVEPASPHRSVRAEFPHTALQIILLKQRP
jgi:hypothetical protein